MSFFVGFADELIKLSADLYPKPLPAPAKIDMPPAVVTGSASRGLDSEIDSVVKQRAKVRSQRAEVQRKLQVIRQKRQQGLGQ